VRVPGLVELGVVELGERSIRKFFEHKMTTYAAALAYRGLFALFPFMLLVVALVGVLDLGAVFDRLTGQADPGPLGPAVERGREQAQPLEPLVEQAREQAGGRPALLRGGGLPLVGLRDRQDAHRSPGCRVRGHGDPGGSASRSRR